MRTDQYIGLVRAALWSEPAHWPIEQTEELLILHARQGTGTLVYPAVLGQTDLSSYARVQMKSACAHTMQQQVHIRHIFGQAWKALEQAGIRAVLMKGAGLSVLYPEPQMRTWGDIDLFVGKEQYHPACAVMRDTFPDALKFDEELDHYKHYNLIAEGVSIEVHRVSIGLQHPLDERRYARIEDYGMLHAQTIELDGISVRIPEPTFNALFVFMHAWEHKLSLGANVRQLCDLALLLHHYHGSIDGKRLKKWLQALHLIDVWQLYMDILVEHLGLPQEEAPFYTEQVASRAQLLLDDILKGGRLVEKTDSEVAKNRFVRKFNTMKERLQDARFVRRYSVKYSRHMVATVLLHGLQRLFAKDRHWE